MRSRSSFLLKRRGLSFSRLRRVVVGGVSSDRTKLSELVMALFLFADENGKPYAMGSASRCKLIGLSLQKFTFCSTPTVDQVALES
jgi:hypothetical protein